MVGLRSDARLLQASGDLLDALSAQGVDDARVTGALGDESLELLRRGALLGDGVADVGAVEAGDEDRRIGEVEPLSDVLARLVVGGRGQRDERNAGEEPGKAPELHVLRPEVVSPLADAVRLVDGEQGDGHRVQQVEEAVEHQALGRDVEQVQLAGAKRGDDAGRLGSRERRVQVGGSDTVRAQRIDLVLHERDEGRDDDRGSLAEQRRDLEAERLAAAGGHEHERAATADDVVDDLALVRAELRVAEDRRQGLEREVDGGGTCLHPMGPSIRGGWIRCIDTVSL